MNNRLGKVTNVATCYSNMEQNVLIDFKCYFVNI